MVLLILLACHLRQHLLSNTKAFLERVIIWLNFSSSKHLRSETLNHSKDDTIYKGACIDDEQVMEKNRRMLLHQTVDLKKTMTKWNCRQPTKS
jgi:hypothetical protein